jgi:hypothetical protein
VEKDSAEDTTSANQTGSAQTVGAEIPGNPEEQKSLPQSGDQSHEASAISNQGVCETESESEVRSRQWEAYREDKLRKHLE